MLKITSKVFALICVLAMCVCQCGCFFIEPSECEEHIGNGACLFCSVNYFNELRNIVISSCEYDAKDNTYYDNCELGNASGGVIYEKGSDVVILFVIYNSDFADAVCGYTEISSTMTYTYPFVTYVSDTSMGAYYDARDVDGLYYMPELDFNEFTENETEAYLPYAETVIPTCVAMLKSILSRPQNRYGLTIENFGFRSYDPQLTEE